MNETKDTRERVTLLSKKDLSFSYYCGPDKGGQAKNKVHSGVMIRHEDSGAMGRAHDSRSLDQNKRSAFERLCKTPQMKFWIARQLYELRQKETMEETVERDARPENCRFEIKENGQWKEVPNAYFDTEQAKAVEA